MDQLKIALTKVDSAKRECNKMEEELYQMRRTLDAVKAERDEKWELAVQMEMGYLTCITERDELQRRLDIAENHKQQVNADCLQLVKERDELQRRLATQTHNINYLNREIIKLENRLAEAEEVLRKARKRWLSPNTSPIDVLDELAAALRTKGDKPPLDTPKKGVDNDD